MKHPDKDQILNCILETLKDDEKWVEDHLQTCEQCKTQLRNIEKEIKIIGSFESCLESPKFSLPLMSVSKKKVNPAPILKWAAILITGFITGYVSSTLSSDDDVNVIPLHLDRKHPLVNSQTFVPCEPIDTDWLHDSDIE